MTTVRETKRADELKVGDRVWIDDSHVEILLAEPYNDSFNGVGIFLTYRYLKTRVESVRVPAGVDFILVSDEELAAAAAGVERAQKIADIRAFADFLEQNPWAPLPYENAQADINFADIRWYGERVGAKVDDHLDDRTQVFHRFGEFEYRVIAWHHEGRPAEPAPEAADDLGLDHSRPADGDEAQHIGARVEPHVGAVTDEGLVDETPDPNSACAAHDDAHLGQPCPDRTF